MGPVQMEKDITIRIEDREFRFPVVIGTESEKAFDIGALRNQTGYITLDEGYGNTGSCRSAITFIDGEKGVLRYRGIPIEQLAEHSRFIEVAYLLIWGRLPTRGEMQAFSAELTDNALLHESLRYHFEGFPGTAPPMAMLSAMINALSCYHPDVLPCETDEQLHEAAARIISKVRTIAAFSYKMSLGEPFMYPDPNRLYVSNLLYMMFSVPHRPYEVVPEVERAINLILLLHADHEQNCSTSTVRMVGSSRANLFASISAGVCALWGPLHGGANQAVIEMLETIHKGRMSPQECIELAKNKDSGFRLMGFGHRVYKNYDPRAAILRGACDKVFQYLKRSDPLLDIARKLEELALKDSYFVDRKLYPNVDFYSGIIMRAIGIPTNMFPVMFAIGRLPGWIAHWKEQHDCKESRIARPRQVYVGPTCRDYVAIEQR
jgi:citrate synthase